jgi:cysteinyl-tRNA synthetase
MVKYWLHNGLMRAGSASGKVGGKSDRDTAGAGAAGAGAPGAGAASATAAEEQATVDTKISRSKGAGGLADLIGRQSGDRLRFFLLRTHYRSTIVFSEEEVAEAGTGLDTFHRFFERYTRVTGEKFHELSTVTRRAAGEFDPGSDELAKEAHARRAAFLAKLDDDFNTGGAISELFDLVRALNKFVDQHQLEEQAAAKADHVASLKRGVATLRELSAILGLFRAAPPKATAGGDDALVGKLVQLLIELRADARGRKDFATADKIRLAMGAIGVVIEDRKGGTEWRVGS